MEAKMAENPDDPSRVPILPGNATEAEAKRMKEALRQLANLGGEQATDLLDVRMTFEKDGPHPNSWVSDEGYTLRREGHLWRVLGPDNTMVTKDPIHDRIVGERLAAKHFLGLGKKAP